MSAYCVRLNRDAVEFLDVIIQNAADEEEAIEIALDRVGVYGECADEWELCKGNESEVQCVGVLPAVAIPFSETEPTPKLPSQPRHDYRVMRFTDALGACVEAGAPADAYRSDDNAARAFDQLLASGYRWIRTDGEWAIFEKSEG